jgi:N-acetylmuramoyl-L-alanine amidase
MKRIIIDPGHGGNDSGARGVLADKIIFESELNLDIAVMLSIELSSYQPILTRRANVFVELDERAAVSNRNNADLFISIHCNAADDTNAKGVEVWYCEGSEKGRHIADCVMNRLSKLGLKSRGTKAGGFAVLRQTKCPAILVECGFMSNTEELGWLNNDNNKLKIAEAIAGGVFEYLHQ